MFRFDGPFMQKATKLANILYVHILALLCLLPVITAGAGFTALEYVLLKICKEEDANLTKTFFRSFKENFKQATAMWIAYLLVASFVIFDIYFLTQVDTGINWFLMLAVHIIGVLLVLNMTWGFVLLSRYCNSAMQTVKYAFSVSFIYIGRTLVMLALVGIPVIMAIEYLDITPFAMVIGALLSGYCRPKLYSNVFDRIEGTDRKENSEEIMEKES